ncbi:GNAT family N-acetyltransferase [Qipengyuania mesophila]|uniref:GNAT family N-acetyltransferase n=1 Tax=Qipengyuania mesophila TaxID=2867246 RepID=UPI001FFCB3AD|nr:GNAT family N-acetyltransferase [Qipengyuania mesophila]
MTQIEAAKPADAEPLKLLVERAYRGDSARQGWNHEADILDDERISLAEIETMLADPAVSLLVARGDDGRLTGCVAVTRKDDTLGYLGTFCVDPQRQSAGLGRTLLDAAENDARSSGLAAMEMTVITQREVLIAWYERRGYRRTGETRPFPVLRDPPLRFVVLEKPLTGA